MVLELTCISVLTENSIFGSDIDQRAFDATSHNLEIFGNNLSKYVNIFRGDFEEMERNIPVGKNPLIVTSIYVGTAT